MKAICFRITAAEWSISIARPARSNLTGCIRIHNISLLFGQHFVDNSHRHLSADSLKNNIYYFCKSCLFPGLTE